MVKLKELYKRFVIGDIKNTEKEPNVNDWYSFLNGLCVPKDIYDESFNKYLCRMYYFGSMKKIVLNLLSFFVLIPVSLVMLFYRKKLPMTEGNLLILEKQPDVGYSDIFPEELNDKYDNFIVVERESGKLGRLAGESKQLYLQAWKKCWIHPYFLLWIIKELSIHSNYIEKYNPRSLVFYINERNVASPILSALYEKRGGKLISFMHGEYLLRLIQGYMHFSEYYIWDESYINMFQNTLHCNIEEYHIYTPLKLRKKWHLEEIEPSYYCTYYFCAEDSKSISIISNEMKKLVDEGYKCKVRPHPRYSHYQIINEQLNFLSIEDPHKVSIEKSLANTQYVIGLNTTVLAEAWVEGRKVVIDNLSNVAAYENLKARNSLAIKREHILLSEFVKQAIHKVSG